MKGTSLERAVGVEVTTDIPFPSMIKNDVEKKATSFLDSQWHRFGVASIHIHLKRVGTRVGCYAHLFTDLGSFHAFADDWDVRRAAKDCLQALETQLSKRTEKQTLLHA